MGRGGGGGWAVAPQPAPLGSNPGLTASHVFTSFGKQTYTHAHMHTHTLCGPERRDPPSAPENSLTGDQPLSGPGPGRGNRLSTGHWEGGALGPPLAPALSSVLEFRSLLWARFLRCEVDSPSRPRLSQPPGAGTDEGDRKALLETWKHWEVVGGVLRTPRAPLSPKGLQ